MYQFLCKLMRSRTTLYQFARGTICFTKAHTFILLIQVGHTNLSKSVKSDFVHSSSVFKGG